MRSISLLVGAGILASCTTSPPAPSGMEAQARLQQMLAGKVAGAPMSCIPDYHSSASTLMAPGAIAFRVNPGLVYVMNTAGTGCEGLTNPHNTLVVKSHGPNTLCSGDTVEIRDLQAGMLVGSCLLGEFTPYHG